MIAGEPAAEVALVDLKKFHTSLDWRDFEVFYLHVAKNVIACPLLVYLHISLHAIACANRQK